MYSSKEKQASLESVLNNTESSIMLLKAVRNKKCQIVDFEYVYTNDQTLRSVERKSLVGKKMTEQFPEVKNPDLLNTYIAVAETGQSFKGEADINPFGYPVWAQVFAQKFAEGVLVTYFDITERKKTEEEIFRLKDEVAQRAQDKYQALFDSIDEGFAIQEVVTDENGNATDVIYLEVNEAFEKISGMKDPGGKKASEMLPKLEQHWLDTQTHIYKTGTPLRGEHYSTDLGKWITFHFSRIGAAGSPLIGVVFNDITERKQRELHQQFLIKFSDALRAEPDADAIANYAIQMLSEHLQLDHCYVGIASLNDNRGTFPYQFGNEKVPSMPADGVSLSDFPDALRTTFEQTLVIADFQNIEGLTQTEKQNFAALGFGALVVANVRKEEKKPYWSINAVSARPRNWTVNEIQLIEDVTERTWAAVERAKAEEALRASEEKYRTLFETMSQAFQENEIIRDENGRAIDHMLLSANPQFERLTGLNLRDFIRVPVRQIFPHSEDFWLELFDRVARSGIPERHEHKHATLDRWFDVYAFSIKGDRVGVLFDDISERIAREEREREAEAMYRERLEREVRERTIELKESRDSLQTIFDTTLVGMSVFAPVRDVNGQITDFRIVTVNRKVERSSGRSDMIGRLYAELFPGIKEMGLFDLMVKTIETGEPGKMDYHYTYEGIDRWYSTMFVKGEDILVSTNIDITERILAEEQLRKLEADKQREIFEVSLSALEKERHRISESLHNGIGQLLYGAKINMTGFGYGMAQEEFKENKTYIGELLTEAIKETRRISHELMPTTLEQFGLKSAIDDICTQLSNGTKFRCHITGLHRRIEKYLELAVYRTAQELMTNVVKHAQATECEVEISIGHKTIRISVQDNGQGMPAVVEHKPGIGLAAIRSKIELLKGKVSVDSKLGKGTFIEVIIPKPEKTEF